MIIQCERIILRSWRLSDREALAAMHADLEVMHDRSAPLSRTESDAKLERYQETLDRLGFGRMAIASRDGEFLGYTGIMPIPPQHRAVGDGVEIGWRLVRRAWGKGIATEAARAVLAHGFREHRFLEVLSYTSPSNLRSQNVMTRLGLDRQSGRDFIYEIGGVRYANIVFVALPPLTSQGIVIA
jgi:RimJ/RimL family protein N-acetyltransferase